MREELPVKLSGTTAARGLGMRADRRRNSLGTDEGFNEAGAAVVPDMSRRVSRIRDDFSAGTGE